MRNVATQNDAGVRRCRAMFDPGMTAGARFGRMFVRWPLLMLALGALSGCGRTLTIRQDPYINTAAHANRPPDKRTGEPLELTIVCIYPKDLEKPANELLRPESKITSKDWYDRRPVPAGQETGRFDLPKNQVYVLTNDSKVFGRQIGSSLRGAIMDGEKPIKKTGIIFEGGWAGGQYHDPHSVIYVFPKFIDRDGAVLPLPPAKFHPPGAYVEDLEIKIGVDPDRPLEAAQYVRVLSERKMHGKEDK